MNLRATPGEAALRDEVRDWLRAQPAVEYGMGLRPARRPRREFTFGRAGRRSSRRPVVGVAWPEEFRRARRRTRRALHRHRRARRARAPEIVGRSASTSSVPRCSRTELRAEGALSPASLTPPRSGASFQRTRRRQRPDVARRAANRSTAASSSTVRRSDELRAVRRLGLVLARTDPDAPKSKGNLGTGDRHARVRRRRPPLRQITDESEFNEVFFSDVVSSPTTDWSSVARRLARRELHADARAGGESAPNSSRTRSSSTKLWDSPRKRLARRSAPAAVWPRRSWRSASPTAQLGSISRTAKGADPGPVGQHQQAVVERDEQTLHDTAMAVLGPRNRCGRGARQPGDGVWPAILLYYSQFDLAGTKEIQRNRHRGNARSGCRATRRLDGHPKRIEPWSLGSVLQALADTLLTFIAVPVLALGPRAVRQQQQAASPRLRRRRRRRPPPTVARSRSTPLCFARPGEGGGTVTVTNNSASQHTVTADNSSAGFNVTIDAGKPRRSPRRDRRHVQVPLQHPQLHARLAHRELVP